MPKKLGRNVAMAGWNSDLRGRVENLDLKKTESLYPLFEAVVNSFHAIGEAKRNLGAVDRGYIHVELERDESHPLLGEDAGWKTFTITDNGIGFDSKNFESFRTADSRYKKHLGAKGIGRFMWLKAYEKVRVDSTYLEAGKLMQVGFDFTFDINPDEIKPVIITGASRKTKIKLENIFDDYRATLPKTPEAIAMRLLEHCIVFLSVDTSPNLVVSYGSERYDLNEIYQKEYKEDADSKDIVLKTHKFTLQGIRCQHDQSNVGGRIILAANERQTVTEKIKLPDFSKKLQDGNNQFSYLVIVRGDYLDNNVKSNRTGFNFSESKDESSERLNELTTSEILQAATDFATLNLKDILDKTEKTKIKDIETFVEEEPQYRFIANNLKADDYKKIPPNPSNSDLEKFMHEHILEKQKEAKKATKKVMESSEDKPVEDMVVEMREALNATGTVLTTSLADYVMRRKAVLQIFEKAIQRNETNDKYPLEKVVHNIIFPMGETSGSLPTEDSQNLWILDERLNFHRYLASDKPIASSGKEPDLVVFQNPMVYGSENNESQVLSSAVLFELKRPMRTGYTNDNPLDNVYTYLGLIRSGKQEDYRGRPIQVGDSPIYAYLVCDLTVPVVKILMDHDFKELPGKRGYWKIHEGHKAFIEVIGYDALLKDAYRRNKVFFDKLGLAKA